MASTKPDGLDLAEALSQVNKEIDEDAGNFLLVRKRSGIYLQLNRLDEAASDLRACVDAGFRINEVRLFFFYICVNGC